MSRRQASRVVAATALIGLGTIFLIARSLDLSWNVAWPLFVIFAGVTSAVGVYVHGRDRRQGRARLWAYTWPVVWIVAGGLLLAATTGRLGDSPWSALDAVWPWAALALGGWYLLGALLATPPEPVETLDLPLGSAAEAHVAIRFGAGALRIGPARAGRLVDGTFRGGVVWHQSSAGRVELEQDLDHGLPWVDHDADWRVGLSDAIPLDLRLDTGACRSELDLSDLNVRTLELHTGASQTRARLPRAAGATRVSVEAGAAEVVLEIPTGVAARIGGRVAIGSLTVDEGRFPKGTDGLYRSVDYPTALNRVDVDVQGGLGSVRILSATPTALAA